METSISAEWASSLADFFRTVWNQDGVLASNGVIMLNTVQPSGFIERTSLGVKERQEREREAVSRAILDAARDLFVAEGYQNVSIRKIADRIEYSPAAIYSYFPSKDDIFFALAEEGFRLLFARTNAPVRRPAPRRGADRRRPGGLLALLPVQPHAPRVLRADVRRPFGAAHHQPARALLVPQLDEGTADRRSSRRPSTRAAAAGHRAAHGLPHSQHRDDGRGGRPALGNRFAPGEDPEALARDTLEAALAGLRAGIPLSFQSKTCGDSSARS